MIRSKLMRPTRPGGENYICFFRGMKGVGERSRSYQVGADGDKRRGSARIEAQPLTLSELIQFLDEPALYFPVKGASPAAPAQRRVCANTRESAGYQSTSRDAL